MGDLHDAGDIVRHEVPLAAQHFADVHDHVEFGRPVGEGLLALEDFDRRQMAAVGETDGRARSHRGPREQLGGEPHGVGFDADGGDVVLARQ